MAYMSLGGYGSCGRYGYSLVSFLNRSIQLFVLDFICLFVSYS